jgi:hypothetical protein
VQNYYEILTVENGRKDEASIIEIFAAIKNNELPNDLKLLNYHMEVPVSFGAAIDHIEKGLVEMTVHQLQALLMLRQKMTLIKSKHFQHDVIAVVNKVEVDNGFAFLTRFSYGQILSDHRKLVRVKVTESIEVAFQFNKLMLRGTLKDISIGGVAILATENFGIEENASGMVKLWLQGTKLEVPGKVIKVLDDSISKNFIIQWEAGPKSEEVISQFIFQTQSEIIRKLKDQII